MGVWRTVKGKRLYIEDGQSLSDAMAASGKFGDKKEKVSADTKLSKGDEVEYALYYDSTVKGKIVREANNQDKEKNSHLWNTKNSAYIVNTKEFGKSKEVYVPKSKIKTVIRK